MSVRTSKTRTRTLPKFDFDSALRDMRADKAAIVTKETREEWSRRQVQEALQNPNRTRRF